MQKRLVSFPAFFATVLLTIPSRANSIMLSKSAKKPPFTCGFKFVPLRVGNALTHFLEVERIKISAEGTVSGVALSIRSSTGSRCESSKQKVFNSDERSL
jgi:hypothetical protein